jgi:hypothetical protein
MANEVFDSTDVVRQVFREGQSVTDEAGDALPHGVIEALNMISFAGVLRNGFVLRRRNDPCVDGILIRIKRRLLPVDRRQIGPQLLRTRVTTIPDVERNDLPSLLIHSDPHPLLVGLFRHEAPHLIRFYLQTPDDHLPGSRYRQHMQMIRQRRKASDDKAHKPPDTDPYCPADAMEGNVLAEQAFHEGALLCAHPPMVRLQDKLATTRLALMVLLPSLQMTISLESLGTTCWTCFSYDHNALPPP